MAAQGFYSKHFQESNAPISGIASGRGFTIAWQGKSEEIVGANAGVMLRAIIGRFDFYQTASNGKFACEENAACIDLLQSAIVIEEAVPAYFQEHWVDADGNPAGGISTGRGYTISWQNGPLGRVGTDERRQPNGAFVEDVIAALQDFLKSFETCNVELIEKLEQCLQIQQGRTARRTADKTEGTHEGN